MTIGLTEAGQSMLNEKNGLISEPVYDNISDFIRRFEAKEAVKKKKKADKLKKGLEEHMEDNE